jgi:hypothetical protein
MSHDNKLYGPGMQPDTFGQPDDNFENFIDNWPHYRNHLIVFLGAGASIGAVSADSGEPLPTAIGLRDALWSRFMLNPAQQQNPPHLGLMSLEHATALIEAKVGRGPLTEDIGKRFQVTEPLWPHAALPFLAPRAVYTTNYDELIELGWQRHSPRSPIVPVFADAQLRISTDRIPLFKPHGTAQHAAANVGDGGIVLTQFDYFAMLQARRGMLETFLDKMSASCVVFIGYSFQDMDIASRLHELRRRDRDRHWYAVFPRNDANVRTMYLQQYGIRQINRTFADFMAEVGQRLQLIPPGWESALPLAPRRRRR